MITDAQRRHTNTWLHRFRQLYLEGLPMRIHSRELDLDGNPEWSHEMRKLMTGTDRREQRGDDEPGKVRIRRAMKRLRNVSVREYEVLLRVMVRGESLQTVTDWLNERAIAGGHPERYTAAHTATIVYAAVDKLQEWY